MAWLVPYLAVLIQIRSERTIASCNCALRLQSLRECVSKAWWCIAVRFACIHVTQQMYHELNCISLLLKEHHDALICISILCQSLL